MSNFPNPYSPVATGFPPISRPRQPLAGLDKRLIGSIVDGLFAFVLALPGILIVGISIALDPQAKDPPPLFFVGAGLGFVGVLASAVIQIVLLVKRSQTFGKYMMKTQIVDVNTGQPADFVHTFLLRLLVNGFIGGIPCVGPIYTLVDICFIFREDRRCIHDLLASTCVVDIS